MKLQSKPEGLAITEVTVATAMRKCQSVTANKPTSMNAS